MEAATTTPNTGKLSLNKLNIKNLKSLNFELKVKKTPSLTFKTEASQLQ